MRKRTNWFDQLPGWCSECDSTERVEFATPGIVERKARKALCLECWKVAADAFIKEQREWRSTTCT